MAARQSSKGGLIAKDLTGMKFGRLTVESRDGRLGGHVCWKCRCECGAVRRNTSQNLQRGDVQSCGCLARERAAVRCRSRTKHGMSGTAEYEAWDGMKDRCNRITHPAYGRYGGRGIKVCERWLEPDGFLNFLADVGPRPTPEHTLDRIGNDGNYEPANVRWATMKQQSRNKSNNHLLTHAGETLTVAEWIERTTLNPITFRARLRVGWSLERILTTPVDVRRQRKAQRIAR